jgi:hypothetical protein
MNWGDLSADAMALVHGQEAIERECRACDADPMNRKRHDLCMAQMEQQANALVQFTRAVVSLQQ